MFGYKKLKNEIGRLQNTINLLMTEIEQVRKYKGNPYTSYSSAIKELDRKYRGVAQWGNHLTQIIIDIRTAFILGGGLRITGDENSKEYEFIQNLMELNDIDEEVAIDWAKEAEIEGKFLARLYPNRDKKNIDVRHISYTGTDYKVETEPDDYKKYVRVRYRVQGAEKTLEADEFVYKRFAGRENQVNETMPKLATVLRNIEDLDKALWDLRKINHYFASPTPYFKVENGKDVDNLYNFLKDTNWKIGKLLVSNADFELKGYTGTSVDALFKEIETHAKIISGTTGVPVHYLGIPDLLSNRATAENLLEVLYSSTEKERKVWVGFYEELFDKAMLMANKNFQQNYKLRNSNGERTVYVDIPFITPERIKQLVDVWLPLYTAGVLELEDMKARIPD